MDVMLVVVENEKDKVKEIKNTKELTEFTDLL